MQKRFHRAGRINRIDPDEIKAATISLGRLDIFFRLSGRKSENSIAFGERRPIVDDEKDRENFVSRLGLGDAHKIITYLIDRRFLSFFVQRKHREG